MMFPTIEAQTRLQTPPTWAILERQLIDKMNAAGPEVLKKYTRSDGTLFWPTHPDFQSIDGLDDAYESFHNWSLFTCSVATRGSWLTQTRNSMSSQTIWHDMGAATVTRWW